MVCSTLCHCVKCITCLPAGRKSLMFFHVLSHSSIQQIYIVLLVLCAHVMLLSLYASKIYPCIVCIEYLFNCCQKLGLAKIMFALDNFDQLTLFERRCFLSSINWVSLSVSSDRLPRFGTLFSTFLRQPQLKSTFCLLKHQILCFFRLIRDWPRNFVFV